MAGARCRREPDASRHFTPGPWTARKTRPGTEKAASAGGLLLLLRGALFLQRLLRLLLFLLLLVHALAHGKTPRRLVVTAGGTTAGLCAGRGGVQGGFRTMRGCL